MKDTLTHKGFIGSVHYNSNDRVFFGKIEGINDLVTFEGTSVDELENAFKFMVDEHIKDCEEEGIPVEKSYKGSFNIRLNPGIHKKAAQLALMKGITLNQLVQKAIKREIEAELE
jgi:predicted HicB family RNase H-like nuclease